MFLHVELKFFPCSETDSSCTSC